MEPGWHEQFRRCVDASLSVERITAEDVLVKWDEIFGALETGKADEDDSSTDASDGYGKNLIPAAHSGLKVAVTMGIRTVLSGPGRLLSGTSENTRNCSLGRRLTRTTEENVDGDTSDEEL